MSKVGIPVSKPRQPQVPTPYAQVQRDLAIVRREIVACADSLRALDAREKAKAKPAVVPLTDAEKTAIRHSGITEAQYRAQQARALGTRPANSSKLSDEERRHCKAAGCSEAAYLRVREARRA